jgi:predicted dithiol-disulfide oxidoreductase (DUF899 family)
MPETLEQVEKQIMDLKKRATELRRSLPPLPVQDYEFRDRDDRPVRLSQLFGDRTDLLVVHNMGRGCRYCTLWADGFIGLNAHINSRCPIVISTPDEPAVMSAFAASRNWPFRMVSIRGTTFASDMGFGPGDGKVWPGVSAFHRQPDGTIVRTARSPLWGPGDDYSPAFHLLDLLKDGPNGWEPQYEYA